MLSAGKESSLDAEDTEKANPASIAELLSAARERGSEVDVSVPHGRPYSRFTSKCTR